MAITHISFDLDGTLVTLGGIEHVLWFDIVPAIYAEKNNVSFSEAFSHCTGEYDKLGEQDALWYNTEHWFKHFGFKPNWKEILTRLCKTNASVFPDAAGALEKLSKKYKLVLFTNTYTEGLNVKMECTGLSKYFAHLVSSTSDLGHVKTSPKAYTALVNHLKIKPENLLHVGDFVLHDYEPARAAGVKAVLVDRFNTVGNGFDKIKTLGEIEKFL